MTQDEMIQYFEDLDLQKTEKIKKLEDQLEYVIHKIKEFDHQGRGQDRYQATRQWETGITYQTPTPPTGIWNTTLAIPTLDNQGDAAGRIQTNLNGTWNRG